MFVKIEDSDVDIVIAALRADLTSFLEEWRSIISRFHLIIIKDPALDKDLQIPPGFDYQLYTKSDIGKLVGATSINFSGHSCRYFGYLVSNKKFIISIDDDCLPARDDKGNKIDAFAQHITNLMTPATPFFFNTLYDPYRKGADFVRGYPFSLREGVQCLLSCGLWLNLADYDTTTLLSKPKPFNCRYVDAVLTVPNKATLPISGINIAFNREVLGPVLAPGFRFTGDGKKRWETLEDIWSGMCVKVVCDHLGFGVKTGLPYVQREGDFEGGKSGENSSGEWKGVKLMEAVVPFFQSVKFARTTISAEDCVVELAKIVREKLGPVDAVFQEAADAMEQWVKLWKAVKSQA